MTDNNQSQAPILSAKNSTCPACNGMGSADGTEKGYDDGDCVPCEGSGVAPILSAELAELRKLAEAATNGPWMRLFGERTVYDRMEDGCRGNAIVRADLGCSRSDAANLDFIAAANPAVILRLLDALAAAPAVPAQEQAASCPALTVWEGAMPESNGKSNFTAILQRKGADQFDTNHFTIARSEYPDRVRYEADCVRHIIGELAEWPDILAYDSDKHSGYLKPTPPAAPQPRELTDAPAGLTVRETLIYQMGKNAAQGNYEVDPMDVVRTVCIMADKLAEMSDEQRAAYPSPLSHMSPMVEAAQQACIERGFTAGGLGAAPAQKEGAAPVESQRQVIAGQDKTHRTLATLNAQQLRELLAAAEGEDDVDFPVEVTLIAHDSPFISLDGDAMAAGLYYYWTEYPEEGIVPLFDAAPVAPHQESAA